MDLASLTFVALLSTMSPAAAPSAIEQVRPLLAAVHHPPPSAGSAHMAQNGSSNGSSSRDSVRNGTLIGFAVGGALGFVAGVTGCGAGSILSMSDEVVNCTGPALMGTVILGAVGAGIGAGIDALLEKAPSPAGVSQGYRRGVRLHIRW